MRNAATIAQDLAELMRLPWFAGLAAPVLAIYVAILGAEFEILDPPELAEHVLALASRLTRAARH